MKEGMIQPRVQRTAPRGPANRVPTKVEELMETGPRGHLSNGDQIRKLSHGHQLVDVYDLVLDQRDRGVASAYGEHAHLDEGEK